MLHLSQTALSDQLQIGHASHPGRSGKNNEDYYGVFSVTTSGGECVVAAVADGIGGSVGGEQASRLTIDTMAGFLEDNRYLATSPGQRLDQAIRLANRAVYDKALNEPALLGMGTTIVAAALDGDRLYVVHAGDSRAYLVRGGRAHQLTLDHSWAQEAIEAGRITPEAAKTHPNRHVIRRYLGINEDVDTDPRVVDPSHGAANTERPVTVISPILTQLGDAIVLCTDGLTDEIGDDEIAKIVSRHSPEEAARRLVDAANAAGGADNITVVILQRGKGGGAAAAGGRSRLAALGLAAMAVLLVGALGWLLASGTLFGGAVNGTVNGASVAEAGAAATDTIVAMVQLETPAPTYVPTDVPTDVPPTATATPEDAGEPTQQAAAGATAVATVASASMTGTAGMMATASVTTTEAMTEESTLSQTPTPVVGLGTGNGGEPAQGSSVTEGGTQRQAETASIVLSPTAAVATSTGVPTATPSSTLAPTSTPAQRGTLASTVTPTMAHSTPVPRPTSLVRQPSTPAVVSTVLPNPAATPLINTPALASPPIDPANENLGPSYITPQSPPRDANSNELNEVTFAWTVDTPLDQNQVYELVFWKIGEGNKDRSNAATGASADTSVTIVPSKTAILSSGGQYSWGVWLAQKEPYKRIRFLGEGGQLSISRSGDGEDCGGKAKTKDGKCG